MNSVLEIIYKQVKAHSNKLALHYLDDGQYIPITYKDMALSAERFSIYLNQITENDSRIVLWSNNCWQWAVTDLAIQLAGKFQFLFIRRQGLINWRIFLRMQIQVLLLLTI